MDPIKGFPGGWMTDNSFFLNTATDGVSFITGKIRAQELFLNASQGIKRWLKTKKKSCVEHGN